MFQTQDMFHNIYNSRKSEVPYQCKFGYTSSVENVKWDTTIGRNRNY